jgi:hypothetical protein
VHNRTIGNLTVRADPSVRTGCAREVRVGRAASLTKARSARACLRELGDEALAPIEPEPLGEEVIDAAA